MKWKAVHKLNYVFIKIKDVLDMQLPLGLLVSHSQIDFYNISICVVEGKLGFKTFHIPKLFC